MSTTPVTSTAKQSLDRATQHAALGVIATAAAVAIALIATPAEAKEKKTGEEELAELLEGRVAGEPQRCIRRHDSDRVRTIDGTAFVYGRGDTIYVQRTRHPNKIDDDDVMVTRKFGTSGLCRLDNITTIDRYSGFFTGAVFFEDFVPYTKTEEAEDS
ncbi:MAG: hypothetical protein ABJ239_06195 [Erythrobacter sp.]